MKRIVLLQLKFFIIGFLICGMAYAQPESKAEVIIGTGNVSSSNVPVYPWYGYSFTQTLYLKSELNLPNPLIQKIAYQYSGTNLNLELWVEVWMGHTTLTQLNSTQQLAGHTKVFDGTWICSSGSPWSEIAMSPFAYNNSDNLLITVIEKKPGWNASTDKFLATFGGSQTMCRGAEDDYNPFNPAALPSGSSRPDRANIKIWTDDPLPGPAISEITPTNLNFGEVGVNMVKVLSVSVKNVGSDPLVITGANSTNSTFSVINTTFPFTLTGFASKTVEIQFLPTTTGAQNGVVSFEFDPLIAGDRDVQVSGQGTIFSDVTIGNGTVQISNAPVYPYYGYSFTQTLYRQNELNFSDKQIYRIGYQYAGTTQNLEFQVEVWMTHTTATQASSTVQLAGHTKVYDGPWFCSPGGFSTIDITPFQYNNTDNLLVTVIEKKPGWNTPSDKFFGTTEMNPVLCVGSQDDYTPFNPNSLPAGAAIIYRPNTKFWFQDIPTGPPVSQITPTTLNFGAIVYGQTVTLPVVIKNVGVDPLIINGYNSSNPHFSLPGVVFPITLGYNQQQTVNVKFTPTTTDPESGAITFDFDPAIAGNRVVQVSGQMNPYTITNFPWIEGFDGGALPEGWKNQVNQGQGWSFFTAPFTHAVIYYFADIARNAELITPRLDITGFENPRLGINHRIYAYGQGFDCQILKSTDGINWEPVTNFTTGSESAEFEYMEFDLGNAKSAVPIYLSFKADFPITPDYYEVVWEIEHVKVYEFIPTFDVTFVVKDINNILLDGASITLDGVTNPAGNYVFSGKPAGTYNYLVQLPGYVKSPGQVTVTNQNATVNVTLQEPGVIVVFPWIESFDDAALPEGWENESIAGRAWSFHPNPHTHAANYSLYGHDHVISNLITPLIDLTGQMEVTFGIQHRFYYYQSIVPVVAEIRVSTDGINWSVVDNLATRVGDANYYDEYDFSAFAGQMIYLSFSLDLPQNTVAWNGYELVWEIDYVKVFTVPIPYHNVTFEVEDQQGNPLDGAVITLNGATNPAGNYLFTDLLPGTYDYTVELDGYVTAYGQVTVVDEDVTELIVLQRPTYVVLFDVKDDKGMPLPNAVITLNSQTNAAGDYLFGGIEAGMYEFAVDCEGHFSGSGHVEVIDQDVTVNIYLEKIGQLVDLIQGWSLISSYQSPEDDNLTSIFANQIQNGSMVIMINNAGIFWPLQNINTMGLWNPFNGYKLKMTASEVVNLKGEMVNDKTVQLGQGINYLPVLSKTDVEASLIFDQIGNKLIFAFDINNGAIFWPDGGIFTLTTLEPGAAYLLNLSAPATVTYPEGGGKAATSVQLVAVSGSQWNIVKTGSSHIISINQNALKEFQNGDIIAAFNTSGQCVGVAQKTDHISNLGLVVYGDDFTTSEVDGLMDNENIHFVLYRSASGEMIELTPVWDQTKPNTGRFAESGLSAVIEFKSSLTGISQAEQPSLTIYPNPASNVLFINGSGNESAKVLIVDLPGRVVLQSDLTNDETRLEISGLKPGIYMVKIMDGEKVIKTEKLLVN